MCRCDSLSPLGKYDSLSTISATGKTGRNAGRCFSHCSIFSFWEYMAPVWNTSATSHQADLINSLSSIKTFMNLRRHEFPAETASKRSPDQQNCRASMWTLYWRLLESLQTSDDVDETVGAGWGAGRVKWLLWSTGEQQPWGSGSSFRQSPYPRSPMCTHVLNHTAVPSCVCF